MTSKFFGGGSSSDSDSDSSQSSDDEQLKKQQKTVDVGKKKTQWAFSVDPFTWIDSESSDDDAQQKRVIRSHADKRYAALQEQIKTMRNHLKIADYSSLAQDYETSRKVLEKIKAQPSATRLETPKFFVKAIADLLENLEKVHTSGEKKLFSSNKAKAFNTLRAKVRKGNADFEEMIAHYTENRDEYEEAEEEEPVEEEDEDSASDSGSDSDSDQSGDDSPDKKKATSKEKAMKKKGSSDSSGSDSDSDSSDDSSSDYSESSESSEDSDMDEEMVRMRRRRRWLKTEADYEAERREKEQRERVAALTAARAAKKKMQTDAGRMKTGESGKVKLQGDDAIKKSEDPEGKIHEMKTVDLQKRLIELVQQRGRKGLDRATYSKKLDFYLNVVTTYNHGPAAQLFLLGQKVIFEFDSYSGAWFECLYLERYTNALTLMSEMFEIYKKWEQTDEEKEKDRAVEADDDQDDTFTKQTTWRTFVQDVYRLDDELYKALQFSQKEMQEFLIATCKQVIFLKDLVHYMVSEPALFKAGTAGGVDMTKVTSRLLEHIYYKKDADNKLAFDFMQSALGYDPATRPSNLGDWSFDPASKASFSLLDTLCDLIERGCLGQVTERVYVLRAELCRAYHYALHDQFRPARDILHYMSMYEKSLEVETHTQILYNRAFAQTGLCAFRLGLIPEAHHYLMELCMYNKAKELLAQGVAFQRFNERNPEQEKTERRRQLPYHMHIPLDHLDAAHLISALLLEVPNMLLQQLNPGQRGRLISRALRKYLDAIEKNVFQTPPETTREYILHSAIAVGKGDWKVCVEKHLPNVKFLGDVIDLKLLEKLIKKEAVRCYCLKHSSSYESLDLEQLSSMFELEKKEVHSICSKMIADGEVPFNWDSSSQILVVSTEHSQTSFHRLALTLSDRCAIGLDQWERNVDYKTGNYAKQDGQGHGRGQKNGEGGFRDIYSDEVRYSNRSRYAGNGMQYQRKGGILTANSKGQGFKGKGKGKGFKGQGKGMGNMAHSGGLAGGKDGMRIRMGGWNRGHRDTAVGFAYKPEERQRSVWS